MHERSERQDEAFRSELPTPASGSSASSADQLTKLADLRDRGVITADEFEREKAKILA
jgi:hypothetical protein